MGSLDGVDFSHALLTALFLASLSMLIPKLLAAASTGCEAQSPTLACWIDNLHRHNPFSQWMAERRIVTDVRRARLRPFDERRGTFLTTAECRKLICPNRKWMLISLMYVLIYVVANVLGALTIMWEETIAVKQDLGEVKYPAFPVKTGLDDMHVRGNCKWAKAPGSGELDRYGFAIFQLCLDVLDYNGTELDHHEVLTTYENKKYRLAFSLETITAHEFDEHWKVSRDNEDYLKDAYEERDYLEDCDRTCEKIKNGEDFRQAIIHQALKEAGMVTRKLEHYKNSTKEFRLDEVLKVGRTRLKTEAWVTMVGVSIVALLWSFAGVVKTDTETDYAIVRRMSRVYLQHGPTSIATVLEPSNEDKPNLVVGHRAAPKKTVTAAEGKTIKGEGDKKAVRKRSFKPIDFVEDFDHDVESGSVCLRVANYVYGQESQERATDGMIIIAYRAEEDEDM